MSVTLGRELFPDSVLTDPWAQVMMQFAIRAAALPLQNRSAKGLIADWTFELKNLRKQKP